LNDRERRMALVLRYFIEFRRKESSRSLSHLLMSFLLIELLYFLNMLTNYLLKFMKLVHGLRSLSSSKLGMQTIEVVYHSCPFKSFGMRTAFAATVTEIFVGKLAPQP